MGQLQEQFGVSQRRVCRVLGLSRHGVRRRRRPRSDNEALVERLRELVRQHPRFGYRRMWQLLVREGWRVNRKRVYRLWRQEGWKVPRKQRCRRRWGSGVNACHRRRAEHKDHVWTWDFIHDRTADGKPLKWLSVLDEYTRECLALEVGRTLNGQRVMAVLERLFAERGVPRHIRSDNGPEYIAVAVQQWLAARKVEVLYVAPGAPWENGYVESFHARVRDELLLCEEFGSLLEARVVGRAWQEEYNTKRPHGSLGYRTPAEFAQGCVPSNSATLRSPDRTPATERLLS